MSHEHQSESGRHRGERREHDAKTKAYEERVYTGWHLSRDRRIIGAIVVAVVIVALTILFMAGFIHW
jgi:hypothetical protein